MNARMTRDELLRRGAAGVTVLSLPGLLAACGGGDDGGGGEVEDVLNFSNWPFYMDTEGKRHPTLEQFTAQTGIEVNYFEDINSNDEYFAKIQGRLSQGQGIDRDIIVATDNSRFAAVRLGTGVLAPVALGHGRDRLEREAHGPGDEHHTTLRGRQAEGQGHCLQ
jgi:spermidine/putrescine transport system substrate-binding protein